MSTALTFEVDCPACGHELHYCASSRPGGLTQRAVMRCGQCRRTYTFDLTMTDATEVRDLPQIRANGPQRERVTA